MTGGFPSQKPVTQSFDVFFDLRLNKRLSKQSRCQWFETPSRSLCRHCNQYPACQHTLWRRVRLCNGWWRHQWYTMLGKLCYNLIEDQIKVVLRNEHMNYNHVIMGAIASQITGFTIVYSTVYSRRRSKRTSKLSLAFLRGIHRWPINSPHKWPVTRKMLPFDEPPTLRQGTSCHDDIFITVMIKFAWIMHDIP